MKVVPLNGEEVHNAYIDRQEATPGSGRSLMKTDDPMYYARIPLMIAYCRDTDTLEIRNGEEVISSYGVAKGR